jgi:hypothetical protein
MGATSARNGRNFGNTRRWTDGMRNSNRTAGCTKIVPKVCQHNFFVLVGLSPFCELTYRITTWMFYVIFLHNLHKLDSRTEGQLSPSCTSLNFVPAATSAIISKSILNPFSRTATLRVPKKWETESARSGLFGGLGGFCDCFLCVLLAFRLQPRSK